MSRPESALERAERIGAELRAATSEAAGVLRDLQRVMREAHEQVDGYIRDQVQATMDAYLAQMQTGAEAFVDEAVADVARMAKLSADRAAAVIDASQSIGMLAEAVAREVAAHTVFEDGEPVIRYGSVTAPRGRPR